MCKIRRLGSPGTVSSAAGCPARLFTNQSITLCFPFVIESLLLLFLLPLSFRLRKGEKKEKKTRGNINQSQDK